MGSFGTAGMRSAGGPAAPIWPPDAPAALVPTPDNFNLLQWERFGDIWVSIIEYPGCTNYEGKKVLVTDFNPQKRDVLDPHFLPGSGLLARFEPTVRGWKMAVRFARMCEGMKDL